MSYVTDISLGPTLSSIGVLRNVNPINVQLLVATGDKQAIGSQTMHWV